MSYYAIVSHVVDDQDRYNAEYIPGSVELIQKHGGRVVVAGPADVIEGQPAPVCVVLKFPDKAAFTDFYQNPAYAPLKEIRNSLTSNGSMVGAPEFG
jgi:uncharacterized protein (DUF1330 family)